VGIEHTGSRLGRAFGLGGTSILWGGQLAEFDSGDFDAAKWPLGYNEIRGWYDVVYKDLLITPQSAEYYRTQFGSEIDCDEFIERFFTHWLPEPNLARFFKKELCNNPRIKILLNGHVNKINFLDNGAQFVVAHAVDGSYVKIPGRNFVFAAGTIETIRFFLSTQLTCDVPWKDNNRIGKFFQDHLGGRIAVADVLNEEQFRNYFENAFVNRNKIHSKLRLRPQARANAELGVSGFFSFRSDIEENIGNLKLLLKSMRSGLQFSRFSTLPKDVRALGTAFFPLVTRFVRDRRILAFFDRSVDFIVQAEQYPIEKSSIKLTGQRHWIDGLYHAEVDWRVDGCEIDSILNFGRRADRYLQVRGIACLAIDDQLTAREPQFLDTLRDTNHQCGGMCMSPSESSGVVDSDCRVWQTSNVYVAGASVFPWSSSANSTFTALALAARLATKLGR
jgi:choline dehydrogenase-like flavoprotein